MTQQPSQHAPLKGASLIDCARASYHVGIETLARNCGYGNDVERLQQALRDAATDLGIEINELSDLLRETPASRKTRGMKIAPDSANVL